MHQRHLINLLLLSLIMALGSIAYLRPGLKQKEASALTSLTAHDITTAQLTTPAGTLRFEKTGDNWWIAGEPRLLADRLQIEQLTGLARAIPARSYNVSELALEKLGFSPDAPNLTLNDISFSIGDTDPINKLRYVRRGDSVHLIRDTLINYLAAPRTQFVSRQLFPDNTTIKSLDLAGFADMPADDRNQLLQQWERAQALWVRGYKTTANWQQTIHITLHDDTTIPFRLRFDEEDLVLGRPDWGIEYHLGSAAAERLSLNPAP